ncbi:MAG: DUF4105 domain-containing protein [Bdellovibrionales bacterium]|nr:DUF4105 domain-containing protein [Bdellovibrionales bacterium]
MPKATVGPNKGKCIDASKLRSIKLFDDSGTGAVTFANFRYDNRWWMAQVDPDGLETASPLLEAFAGNGPISHTMILFRMKRGFPVRLVPQSASAPREEIHLWDFVASAEVAHPKDAQDSRARSFLNDMAIGYGIQALDDKRVIAIGQLHRTIYRLPIDVTIHQMQAMLMDALRTSDERQLISMYNPLTRSCETEALRYVDRALGGGLFAKLRGVLTFLPDRLPRMLQTALEWRGILSTTEPIVTINEELENGTVLPPVRSPL